MIKNLNEYKDQKFAEQTQKDFVTIIQNLTNCIETLKAHSKYTYIMESLSILHNSRTLFEIKLDKLKRHLNE